MQTNLRHTSHVLRQSSPHAPGQIFFKNRNFMIRFVSKKKAMETQTASNKVILYYNKVKLREYEKKNSCQFTFNAA